MLCYYIHHIDRFPSMQDFASYTRLVKCSKEAGGKRYGTSGKTIGHAHLTWAFSDAAVLFLRNHEPGHKLLARLEKTHAKDSPEHPGSYSGSGGLLYAQAQGGCCYAYFPHHPFEISARHAMISI